MLFSDYIQTTITKTNSVLIAGFDPVLETFPEYFISLGSKQKTQEESIFSTLTGYYEFALKNLVGHICGIKPNIAFFEQYGIGGLRALQYILELSRDLKIPTILDVKRGDIGSTAEAYAKAYLSKPSYQGSPLAAFASDSITVNPYLGFETVKVFLDACVENNKGIFVLVKTSNPGSKDLQDQKIEGNHTVSETVAAWIEANAHTLGGSSGVSGLGAVIGATHPAELKKLRATMKNSLFLIPGMGAQGGTAQDVMGGFFEPYKGSIINMSRGLLSAFSKRTLSPEEMSGELLTLAHTHNTALRSAMQSTFGLPA